MMYRIFLIISLFILAPVAQADGHQAFRLKVGTCLGCHGIPNYTNVYPSYRVPKLAGQHAEYLAAALRAYQSGERSHPTMRAQAMKLSEQDILDISKFFSLQPDLGNDTQEVRSDTQNKNLATCAACHTPTGNSTIPINPRLAGQHRDYLYHSLMSYKNGTRKNAIMIGIVSTLTEQDIKELSAFYSHHIGLNTVDVGQTIHEIPRD